MTIHLGELICFVSVLVAWHAGGWIAALAVFMGQVGMGLMIGFDTVLVRKEKSK
jgi:hypothetical protein